MATKVILRFSALVFALAAQAQSVFYKTYGGNGVNTGTDVIQMASDSSFYITGSSSNDAPSQALLLHVDQFGDFIASYFYGGPHSDIGVRVMHKPGVGFWIAGYSNSFSADGNFDFYLVKLNEQYQMVWEKTYGTSNWERLYDAILLPDEGLLLVGEVEGLGLVGKDAYVVRTDANGELVWDETYSGSMHDVAYACKLFDNTSVLVGGSWGVGQANAWLTRLDLDGNVIWSKNDYMTDRVGEIRNIQLENNNIYFYGNWSPLPYQENNQRKYQGVAQLSNALINNVFEGGSNETHVSFKKLKNNRFYSVSKESNPLVVGANGPRASIFGFEGGGYYIGFSHSVHGFKVTPGTLLNSVDTCIVLVGTIQDPAHSTGGSNVLLLKIQDVTFSLEDISTQPILTLESFEETGIIIYPTPSSSSIQIALTTGVVGSNFSIYDAHGALVMEGVYSENLDLSLLPSGIYTLTLLTNRGKLNARIQKQ